MLRSQGMDDVLVRWYVPEVLVGQVFLELSDEGVH